MRSSLLDLPQGLKIHSIQVRLYCQSQILLDFPKGRHLWIGFLSKQLIRPPNNKTLSHSQLLWLVS